MGTSDQLVWSGLLFQYRKERKHTFSVVGKKPTVCRLPIVFNNNNRIGGQVASEYDSKRRSEEESDCVWLCGSTPQRFRSLVLLVSDIITRRARSESSPVCLLFVLLGSS